jgi:hypothetical protein
MVLDKILVSEGKGLSDTDANASLLGKAEGGKKDKKE